MNILLMLQENLPDKIEKLTTEIIDLQNKLFPLEDELFKLKKLYKIAVDEKIIPSPPIGPEIPTKEEN
jgi:hypothetical protein